MKKKIRNLTLGEYFKIQDKCFEHPRCEGCPLKDLDSCGMANLEFCLETEIEIEVE